MLKSSLYSASYFLYNVVASFRKEFIVVFEKFSNFHCNLQIPQKLQE